MNILARYRSVSMWPGLGLLTIGVFLGFGCHSPWKQNSVSDSESDDSLSFEDIAPPEQRWFHTLEDLSISDLSVAPDGSVYLIGASGYHYTGGDTGFFDQLWIGRANAEGRLLWTKQYPIGDPEAITAIYSAIDADETGVRVNRLNFAAEVTKRNSLIRLDLNGNPVGDEHFLAGEANALLALSPTTIAAGSHFDSTNQKGVGWISAIDEQGNSTWTVEVGGPNIRLSAIETVQAGPDNTQYVGGGLGAST